MAQINPTKPTAMINLESVSDPLVRDILRNLVRQLEAVYGQVGQVVNLNLARTVSAAGPNPPEVKDGESIVWIRTDVTPNITYIVSRTGTNLYLWTAAQTMQVPGQTGGGGTPPPGGGGTTPPPTAPVISSFTPTTGPVGTTVAITGTAFTGTTQVLFGGIAATYTVASDTRINCTVPTGAVTGPIRVVTPAGSATSSTSFTVQSQTSSGPPSGAGLTLDGQAICTFHSIGLYWTPVNAGGTPVTPIANPAHPNDGPAVAIRYARMTDTAWKAGHDLWYDSRDTRVNGAAQTLDANYGRPPEARGSIVHCDTGTPYVVQFGLYAADGSITWVREIRPVTWSELGQAIPAGGYGPVEGPTRITTIPSTDSSVSFKGNHTGSSSQARIVMNQSGTPGAWTVYDFTGQSLNLPLNQIGIFVDGAYMILRGLTLTGTDTPIFLQPGCHDVLIELNDISKWCNPSGQTFQVNGVTYQRAVAESGCIKLPHQSYGTPQDFLNTKRIIIQRNKIHDPNFGSWPWDYAHPEGPDPIILYPNGGNNVIRYNETWCTTNGLRDGPQDFGHCWSDGLVNGGDNQSLGGIGPDTDIYKNIIQHAYDDACETDGGGCNTRYWKNYTDISTTGVSHTPVYIGPLYSWRNVYNRCRMLYLQTWGVESDRLQMYKTGGLLDNSGTIQNGGRRCIYHNTALQFPATQQPGATGTGTLGCRQFGTGTGGNGNELNNAVFRNNIGATWLNSSGANAGSFIDATSGVINCDFDYDITSNTFAVPETHGVVATPSYQTGNGPLALATGKYRLNSGTPGSGDATPIPNFNDQYALPDRGAQQATDPDMDFGVNAVGS